MQILTRLNPGTINFEGSRGGIPELTTSDIAACLAGANITGMNILLKRVAGFEIAIQRIYDTVRDSALRVAWRNGWKLTDKGLEKLVILLYLAICEKVATNVCPSCRGTKYSILRPSEHCRTCRGTGKWKIDDYIKAKAIGISKSAYSQTWRERFDDLLLLLETREYQAKRSMYQMLDKT